MSAGGFQQRVDLGWTLACQRIAAALTRPNSE
jgi:hypothetical protein